MKAIIKELFGLEVKNRTVYEFKPGYKPSLYREERLTEHEWCKEFRVSMMYGKEVRHLN
jgi:hypothetical protein